jgi:5-methylcytosine-specific restriction endonuclease McrA
VQMANTRDTKAERKELKKQCRRLLIDKYGIEPGKLCGFPGIRNYIKHVRPELTETGYDLLRVFSGKVAKPKTRAPRLPRPEKSYEATDAFLASYEWRRVRMQVLTKHGARCQCCGSTPADGVKMNVDHIKPRKLYPQLALDLNNLQVLCELCNHGKGNWDMTDWRGNAKNSGTRSRAEDRNDV